MRTATPLAFAALGETVVERGGIINIGLESSIIGGALGGLIASGTQGGAWFSFLIAGTAGLAIALLFGVFTIVLRSDQIITGTAVSLFALGLTGTLYREVYGSAGVALTIPTMPPLVIPVLSSIPFIGRALFAQPPVAYLLYPLIPLTW